jgi:hypothetical protein
MNENQNRCCTTAYRAIKPPSSSVSPLPPPLRGTKSCVAVSLPAAQPDCNADTQDTTNGEPQASTPLRKNAKRSRNDGPRDSVHGERSSPVKRYEGKGPRTDTLSDPFAPDQLSAAAHPLLLQIRTPQPSFRCRSPPHTHTLEPITTASTRETTTLTPTHPSRTAPSLTLHPPLSLAPNRAIPRYHHHSWPGNQPARCRNPPTHR